MNNIICQICKKEFKTLQSLGSHTTQLHKITKEEYYKQYILTLPNFISSCKNCGNPTRFISLVKGYSRCCGNRCGKLYDCKNPEYRENISKKTKLAMKRPDVVFNHLAAVKAPKSQETIKKMSDSGKQKFINHPTLKEKVYTNEERNKRISKSKKHYWNTHPEEKLKVGNIWKIWKEKDELGWRRHLSSAGRKGFEKIMEMKEETSLEIKIYKFLKDNDIQFKKQY